MVFIRAIIYYLLLFIVSAVYACLASIIYLFSHQEMMDNLKKMYAVTYLFILNLIGVSIYSNHFFYPKDKYLWVANHRSKLDGLIVQSVLCMGGVNVISVVKQSIKYVPFIGLLNIFFNSVLVDRNGGILSFQEKVKKIKKTHSVLIFPEGTTMTPESKKVSRNLSEKLNCVSHNNLLLPKLNGYQCLIDNGEFKMYGDITIRYTNPSLSSDEKHSYLDLFRKIPRNIYIDTHTSVQPYDLNELFMEKDKKLDENIYHDNYRCINTISNLVFIFINTFISIIHQIYQLSPCLINCVFLSVPILIIYCNYDNN